MTAQPQTHIAAMHKYATVPQSPEAAFALFTDEIASWWPLASHSVGGHDATTVVFEHGVHGRIIESMADGQTAVWGTVIVWEPPVRLRFTWHPGTPESQATEVEVTFTSNRDGTLVELVHSGWHRRPDGQEARTEYDSGWDYVFGLYQTSGGGAAGEIDHP